MQSLNTLNDYENGLCLFKEALQDQDESELRGVFNGAARIVGVSDHPRHCLHALNCNAAADYVLYGVWVKAKSIDFWLNLGSTTETIIDPVSGNDIEVIAGTLTYSDWDNAYIDGVDTNTIATGWHHVVITSSTDIIMATGFNLGKGDIQVTGPRFWADELSANEVAQLFNVKLGGMGIFLNGNGYASHADNDALDVGTGDFIMSVYIEFVNTNACYIFGKSTGLSISPGYCIGFSASGKRWAKINDGTAATYADIGAVLSLRKWYHVVWVFDRSGNLTTYVDGVADGTANISARSGSLTNSDPFYLTSYEGGVLQPLSIAYPRLFYFGVDGLPTGVDLTNLITGLKTNPGGTLTSYGLSQYEDADATDLWDPDAAAFTSQNVTINNVGGYPITTTSMTVDALLLAIAVNTKLTFTGGGEYIVTTAADAGATTILSTSGLTGFAVANNETAPSGTYAWVKYGNNTLANVGNTLEIAYASSIHGAYNILRNVNDLSADLVIGKQYELTCGAKYTGGAAGVRLEVWTSVGSSYSSNLTTSIVRYRIVFTADSTINDAFMLNNLAVSNVVTIDNLSLKRIGERGNWPLQDGLEDLTSNSLDLSHGGSGNIFAKHGSVGPTKEDTVLLLNFPNLTDLSGNGNDGTNHGADIVPSGRNSGNAFDLISSNSDYIDCGNIGTIKSIVLMINPDNVAQSILDCDGGSHKITVSGGTITATGFTSFYVDGVVSAALNPKSWQLLVVTDSSGLDANALTFGKEGANYFDGMVDIIGTLSQELHMLDIQSIFHRIQRGLLL